MISVGTCLLHVGNNAFNKLLKVIEEEGSINLDTLEADLHGFMANSAARRIVYTKSESITEVTARFMLRHVRTRWLSLEKVLILIIEQWPNLKHFFLVTMVEDKQFKTTISKSEQYQRIVKVLKNEEKTLAYSTFAVYVASIFSKFDVPLQTSKQ